MHRRFGPDDQMVPRCQVRNTPADQIRRAAKRPMQRGQLAIGEITIESDTIRHHGTVDLPDAS